MSTDQERELRLRLEGDDQFYARRCLRIVDQNEHILALEPKPAQVRLEEKTREQEAAGKPVRGIVLKARKEGISTWVQGKLIKRVTQRRNHNALVVAHDGDTAGQLFEIGETMYSLMPDRVVDGLALKPAVMSTRKGKELRLGEPSRQRRLEGHRGLNSSYYVDTANEYESGRGFTYHSLHISELAFWQSAEKKLNALLNAVPDTPNTMVIIESTANGYNRFRRMWVDAVKGNSDFFALFIAWFEDPDYSRPFVDEDEREDFIATIGTGPYGEDEPSLIEDYGVTPEQLNWRRWAIVNRCQSDLRTFWQEYPASWEEAFLATGKQVFSPVLVQKVLNRCEDEQPELGLIKPQRWEKAMHRRREIEIPRDPLWVPQSEVDAETHLSTPWWRRWEPPQERREEIDQPAGQYIASLDSASGEETESGDPDSFAIEIIDHRTLKQVAEWTVQSYDADLVAQELFLAAWLYNRAWVGIETTGGYGLSIANIMWRKWRYPKIYFRRPAERKGEKQEKRLGWNTGTDTKPLLVDNAHQLLRRGRDGIRSAALAGEMLTFVKDEKGRMGAEEDEHDDLLMAWMIAEYIADEKPLERDKKQKQSPPAGPGSKVRAPSMNRRPKAYA